MARVGRICGAERVLPPAVTVSVIPDRRRASEAPRGLRLARGRGRYVDDIQLSGTLHVAFVRSPRAHARIRAIDTTHAARAPGVHAVVTGADLDGVAVMRSDTMDVDTCRATDSPVLARDRVRYVGEAVASVVADDRYAAEDGAGLVVVSYDPLAAVVDIDTALESDAPRLDEGWPDNVLMRTRGGGSRRRRLRRRADHDLRDFTSEAVNGVPLEARACLAASTTAPGAHALVVPPDAPRAALARRRAPRPPRHLLRVICPDMGAASGSRRTSTRRTSSWPGSRGDSGGR